MLYFIIIGMHLSKKLKSGQSLIGVIIAIGIFVILSQAVVTLAFSAYDLISFTRARISARHIAIESIETIRNVSYNNVGTIGGIPSGIFPQEQQIQRNGQIYTIRTNIIYVDDPFDGTAPDDILPTDYKRVKIEVSWGGIRPSSFNEVSLVTDIAPRGVETMQGGGTISILVFDSLGKPIPQAEVRIVAQEVNPPVNATYYTNSSGRLILPGAPICSSCYQISVTKTGMSTDRTYSTSEIANPTKPHITVIESQLTEVSFSIDLFARLNISTRGASPIFPALGGQTLRIRGEKIIGTDGLDNPVYKFDQDVITDINGNLTIEQLEWDNYYISLPPDSTMEIAGTNPISPISANPGNNINLLVSLVPDNAGSLLAVFRDSTNSPVASVATTLKDNSGYEATAASGQSQDPNFGQVFFDGLADKAYTLIATASGFLENISNIDIRGDTNVQIILNPQ